jgi:glycosyltransferase involved in cell wall biosynthesis
MKFGIVTPVFDGCLESLELLLRDVEEQTHKDWTWIVSSNGYSKKVDAFVKAKNQRFWKSNLNPIWRFTNRGMEKLHYIAMPLEETPDKVSLLENIGKRRDYCIKKINSDYIIMLDADAQLLDREMFLTMNHELKKQPKGVCIWKVEHETGLLPSFPIRFGRIDMLNFCVKASLAKAVGYPTTVNLEAVGNDYWFLDRAIKASNGDFLFIDRLFARHNGHNNNSYKNLCKIFGG